MIRFYLPFIFVLSTLSFLSCEKAEQKPFECLPDFYYYSLTLPAETLFNEKSETGIFPYSSAYGATSNKSASIYLSILDTNEFCTSGKGKFKVHTFIYYSNGCTDNKQRWDGLVFSSDIESLNQTISSARLAPVTQPLGCDGYSFSVRNLIKTESSSATKPGVLGRNTWALGTDPGINVHMNGFSNCTFELGQIPLPASRTRIFIETNTWRDTNPADISSEISFEILSTLDIDCP